MSTYFEVVEKDEAPPRDEDVHPEEDCKVEEPQEPDEEDLNDVELARALGACRAASIAASSSVESLHTGLTADLESKVKLQDSPEVEVVTPPPQQVLLMQKRQKIEALKHPGDLECSIP